jgi:tetratricopeptide (TPR) repeat protein
LCSERGEYDRAAHHLQQALAFAQWLGDPRWEAYALLNLAVAAQGRGLREEAREDVDRSLVMFQQVGDWQGTGQAGRLIAALGEARRE